MNDAKLCSQKYKEATHFKNGSGGEREFVYKNMYKNDR